MLQRNSWWLCCLLWLAMHVGSAQAQVHWLNYNPTDGNLLIDVDDDYRLTTVELVSNAEIFTGTKPPQITGIFDVYTPDKLFKLDVQGFGDLDFGPAVTPGLTLADVAADLCARGSLLGGGAIGTVHLADLEGGAIPLTGCPPPPPAPPHVRMNYDSVTGELSFLVGPEGTELSSLLVNSRSSSFIVDQRPDILAGDFDVFRADRLFKLDENGFGDASFGNVYPTDLSNNDLRNDLCVAGSYLDGGAVDDVILNSDVRLSVCQDTDPVDPPVGGDAPVELVYDANEGRLWVNASSPMTTIEIIANDDIFLGPRPDNLTGLFDVYNPDKIFKLDPAGFGALDFGPVVEPGTPGDVVQAALFSVNGSFLGGGGVTEYGLVYGILPEPNAGLMLLTGLFGLLAWRRKFVVPPSGGKTGE
ncbi:MAG: hypothetical protein R3C28_20110 [Pirellulaceae bacterium]